MRKMVFFGAASVIFFTYPQWALLTVGVMAWAVFVMGAVAFFRGAKQRAALDDAFSASEFRKTIRGHDDASGR